MESSISSVRRGFLKLREAGVPISYDMSGRWNQEYYIETIGPQVDIAFASCGDTPEEEIKKLCEALKARGCRMTVATRGGKGSLIYDGEQYYTQKPKLVDAVDTLGAGDSFATAFLLAMLEKKDIHAAMEAGAEFAAKTCLVNGAFGHGIAFQEE